MFFGGINMEVIFNHNQYLDWKAGNKTVVGVKLENLGVEDVKEFTDKLILGLGSTLFVTTNVIYIVLGLENIKFLGSMLSTITPVDYMEFVKHFDKWFQFFSLKKN